MYGRYVKAPPNNQQLKEKPSLLGVISRRPLWVTSTSGRAWTGPINGTRRQLATTQITTPCSLSGSITQLKIYL